MVMIFKEEKPLKHLFTHGRVYTFRTTLRKGLKAKLPGLQLSYMDDWITWKRGGKKLINVRIYLIRKVERLLFLDAEIKDSGYASKKEWIDAIKRLNKGKDCTVGYLYMVTIPAFIPLKQIGKIPTWEEIEKKYLRGDKNER